MFQMSIIRRRFTREFKLKVVQAYESGVSVAELTRRYDIHANLVYKWRQEYVNNPQGAFRGTVSESDPSQTTDQRIGELERMIGRLTVENDFLKKALQHAKSILMKDPPPNIKE
jgi:transposase